MGCLWSLFATDGTSSAPRSVEINGETYQIRHVLGDGGFATVFAGVKNSTGEEVALKRIRFSSGKRAHVDREIKFLQVCKPCDFVVNLLDYDIKSTTGQAVPIPSFKGDRESRNSPIHNGSPISSSPTASCDSEAFLVLEKCASSAFSILQTKIADFRLRQNRSNSSVNNNNNSSATATTTTTSSSSFEFVIMPIDDIHKMLDCVISAVGFLHSQEPHAFCWFDCKLENILQFFPHNNRNANSSSSSSNSSSSGENTTGYKICDGGSATTERIAPCANSKHVNAASVILDELLTFVYRSPESLDLYARHSVDTKADVWAIGVSLFTLISGHLPFEPSARSIIDGKYQFPETVLKENSPYKNLVKLVQDGLLVADPQKRWSVFELSKKFNEMCYPKHKIVEAPKSASACLMKDTDLDTFYTS